MWSGAGTRETNYFSITTVVVEHHLSGGCEIVKRKVN